MNWKYSVTADERFKISTSSFLYCLPNSPEAYVALNRPIDSCAYFSVGHRWLYINSTNGS